MADTVLSERGFPVAQTARRGEGKAPPVLIVASLLTGQGPTGVETHANAIVAEALAAGIDARFLSPQHGKDWRRRLQGVRVRVLRRIDAEVARRETREADAAQLERKLRHVMAQAGDAPITVYAQDPLSARAAIRARGERNARAVRVVMTVHFNVSEALEMAEKGITRPDGALWKHTAALENEVLKQVDHLIFVSAFMQGVVMGRQPALAGRASSVIPNFCKPPAGSEAAGPVAQPSVDLLAIGTLEPRKNQQFLLDVLFACKQRGRIYRCTIVGHGPDGDTLRRRARELGVDAQVDFLGHRPGASALLPSHRVLVHGARMENMPITLVEAMACGRPVMAAAVGGIPEVIEHGVQGFHWPLDDAGAAADRLIELLESPGLWQRMSAAGRQRYEQHYCADVLGPRWLATIMNPTTP